MKKLLLIAFVLYHLTSSAQDMIYLADGTKIPGKVAEISTEKVKFKNLANPNGPLYSRNSGNVQVAFNSAGDYLVFAQAKPLTDKEKDNFISATPSPRSFDVLVDGDGKVMPVTITDETETDITANSKGADVKLLKSNLVFLIRKNGTHELFSSVELALPYLALDKPKISTLLTAPGATTTTKVAVVTQAAVAPVKAAPLEGEYVTPDLALFGKRSLEKTEEFTGYLQTVASPATTREAAAKSINQACGLFLNEDARVEVSSSSSAVKAKYKIRDYLNRLQLNSGKYDKVNIEYANINYASKFKKGADGNYYGSVTFVQKFQGFVDGNLVYGDVTKRSMTIVLKHYEKAVNGETTSGWDVYLDDIGVVQTKKI
jgi:hypothetical protein